MIIIDGYEAKIQFDLHVNFLSGKVIDSRRQAQWLRQFQKRLTNRFNALTEYQLHCRIIAVIAKNIGINPFLLGNICKA